VLSPLPEPADIRRHANPDHDVVGLHDLAGREPQGSDRAVRVDALDRPVRQDADAARLVQPGEPAAKLRPQHTGQRGRGRFDDRHLGAESARRRCDFEPDEPAADHDKTPPGTHHRPQRPAIVECPQ